MSLFIFLLKWATLFLLIRERIMLDILSLLQRREKDKVAPAD